MSTLLIVLIVLLLLGVGGIPWGGYHSYGWGPSGGIGLIVVMLIVILLLRGGL